MLALPNAFAQFNGPPGGGPPPPRKPNPYAFKFGCLASGSPFIDPFLFLNPSTTAPKLTARALRILRKPIPGIDIIRQLAPKGGSATQLMDRPLSSLKFRMPRRRVPLLNARLLDDPETVASIQAAYPQLHLMSSPDTLPSGKATEGREPPHLRDDVVSPGGVVQFALHGDPKANTSTSTLEASRLAYIQDRRQRRESRSDLRFQDYFQGSRAGQAQEYSRREREATPPSQAECKSASAPEVASSRSRRVSFADLPDGPIVKKMRTRPKEKDKSK